MCSQSVTAFCGQLTICIYLELLYLIPRVVNTYDVRIQVGALEEAQLAVHRQRAAEALTKQEALEKQGATDAA